MASRAAAGDAAPVIARPAAGYVSHAEENRRQFWLIIALYVVSFEMIGGMAATFFLLMFDPAHTLLTDPLGYLLRYAVPMALLAFTIFYWLFNRHAEIVEKALDVRPASMLDEPRFVAIAEEQCLALGVRLPRFGVIEVPQPNALSVGEDSNRGLIAVTRGLLDALDDEELAAVLAHEASHIRNGDTRVQAANFALMRTAVLLQLNNALRFEDWRQLMVPLFLPPFLTIMLLSGIITKASIDLARMARRGLKLSRDHIADGEAVRVTHRPDALHSALMTVGGKGAFTGSARFDDVLFDGRSDADGGTHPAVVDRLRAISGLAGSMMQPGLARRDTRARTEGDATPRRATFGRKLNAENFRPVAAPAEPEPEKPRHLKQDELLKLMLFDRPAYLAYTAQHRAYYEWRPDDRRNWLGLKPDMSIPVAAVALFLVVLHFPHDGNWRRFVQTFSPGALVTMFAPMSAGPFCSGPSYPDGRCP